MIADSGVTIASKLPGGIVMFVDRRVDWTPISVLTL